MFLLKQKSNKKQKLRVMPKPAITRASQEPSPLELYNPTQVRLSANGQRISNPMQNVVTHTLDFGLKKAGSIVECPHKIYSCYNSIIQPPTNMNSDWKLGFAETADQSAIDNIRLQDSSPAGFGTATNQALYAGCYTQVLFEFDLSSIATQYGWDNAKLKAQLKKLTVEAWASGSGNNGGITGYGVQLQIWSVSGGSWVLGGSTVNSGITKLVGAPSPSVVQNRVNSSNKLYVLLNATYPASSTIASTVNLDFIRLLVDVDTAEATADNYFIGGDTQTLTYDFGTKVANSVLECPMKFYYCKTSAIQPPTNITGSPTTGWIEDITQSRLDYLKNQDNSYSSDYGAVLSNAVFQLMVEVDLTPLCNAYFGGSNAALKAGLKGITVDAWAMGSGANAGSTAYGAISTIWDAQNGMWASGGTEGISWEKNINSSIAKITFNRTSVQANCINSSNKIYILIASQYASDGTIASSVSLDFIQVRVDIARTPDVVTPVPVNLPKYWAMLVQGFSPSYDTTNTRAKRIFDFVKADGSAYRAYLQNGSIFFFNRNATTTQNSKSISLTFNKNQIISMWFEVNILTL
jgi:hypothetical protein